MYYDDPIIAAYMAKEFGVEFVWQGGKKIENAPRVLADYVGTGIKRFDIHPDSLHIFEPQAEDIVKYKSFLKEVTDDDNGYGDCCDLADLSEWVDDWESNYILERNGKPFFTPKTES